jgi:hypothetical protein
VAEWRVGGALRANQRTDQLVGWRQASFERRLLTRMSSFGGYRNVA